MLLLFLALSIFCSYFSAEECWNIFNMFPALLILALFYTSISRKSPFRAIPVIILMLKDIIWWIVNVGINFANLALIMQINGILKILFDISIIYFSLFYSFNKTMDRHKKRATIIILMSIRTALFIIPIVLYHVTFDNILVEILSMFSYAFLFTAYYISITKHFHRNR